MSERQADFEMLRAFVRQGDQPAFAAVARRQSNADGTSQLSYEPENRNG
jgi:hypothetical protein